MKPNRAELLRLLMLAEQGQLKRQELLGDDGDGVIFTLTLGNLTQAERDEDIRQSKLRGATFITMNIGQIGQRLTEEQMETSRQAYEGAPLPFNADRQIMSAHAPDAARISLVKPQEEQDTFRQSHDYHGYDSDNAESILNRLNNK